MKQWGSAIFPLSILFVLGLLTFWLRYASEIAEPKRDGKHRHDPDYIVGDATLRKIDVNGALKYTLKAKDIRHYPDDDSTDLIEPNLVSLNADMPPVTMTCSAVAATPRSSHAEPARRAEPHSPNTVSVRRSA